MSNLLEAQSNLNKAFLCRDLKKFKEALVQGADPTVRYNDHEMCIFEQALSSPGCCKFIDCCLYECCENTYVNNTINKAAINYVADSADPHNLSFLVRDNLGGPEIDHQYKGDTALHTLCKNLNSTNIKNSTICIAKLLQCGASPDISDNAGKTPFHYVMHNYTIPPAENTELVLEFLCSTKFSDEKYRQGLNFLDDVQLNGKDKRVYTVLSRQLVSLDDFQMMKKLTEYQNSTKDWDKREIQSALLIEFIINKREKALKSLLSVMRTNSEEDNLCLVKEALGVGCSWSDLLAMFMSNKVRFNTSNKLDLLKIMVKSRYISKECSIHYDNCLEYLLKRNEKSIDYIMKLAVEHRNNCAIRLLLHRGARLDKSNLGSIGIDVLESHFDSCITSFYQKPDDKNFRIKLNISNFLNTSNVFDMTPITHMVAIEELQPLRTHPLIDSLLQIVWMRLRIMYYAHLAIFTILCISLVAQILFRTQQGKSEKSFLFYTGNIICWAIAAFLALNKLLNLIQFMWHWPKEIFDKILNIRSFVIDKDIIMNSLKYTQRIIKHIIFDMELCRALMLILTCLEYGNHKIQNTISVITILLLVIKLNYLFGSLPIASVSKNMLMLREVANTFINCLTQYSIFVFAFGLCFYVLFHNLDQTNDIISSTNEVHNQTIRDNGPITFINPIGTFIITFMMFFGQHDVNTEFNSFYTCWILVLFMFMVMILTNLLGALAINDIQTVKLHADIRATISRTELLNSYEFALQGGWGNLKILSKVIKALVKYEHEEYFSKKEIHILPHFNNRVSRFGALSSFKVENGTVNKALKIVEKRNRLVEQNSDKKNTRKSVPIETHFKDMSNTIESRFKTIIDQKLKNNLTLLQRHRTDEKLSLENRFDNMSALLEERFETLIDKKLNNLLKIIQVQGPPEALEKPLDIVVQK